MNMNANKLGGAARIAMPGQFDFTMYRGFMKICTPLLKSTAVSEIEVELGAVDYLDRFALDMLILLKERAVAANKSMSLLNISDPVRQSLEFTQLGFNIKSIAPSAGYVAPACS